LTADDVPHEVRLEWWWLCGELLAVGMAVLIMVRLVVLA
jgi:hypothetical protein